MADLTDSQRQSIEAAIFAGQKIDAIKRYRESIPGAGLADAKSAVEVMEAKLRTEQPGKFTAPARKSGCIGVVAVVCLMLALAGIAVVMATWF